MRRSVCTTKRSASTRTSSWTIPTTSTATSGSPNNLFLFYSSVWDLWHFGVGADPRNPYLWLTDLDPTSDPTPFLSDFPDAKKKFSPFFLITYGTCRHIIFSRKNLIFLLKCCVEILFAKHYFSPLNNFNEKREGSGSRARREPGSYIWLIDPDPGGQKHADPAPEQCFIQIKNSGYKELWKGSCYSC